MLKGPNGPRTIKTNQVDLAQFREYESIQIRADDT